VVERRVDHGIRLFRAGTDAVEVFQRAPVRFGTGGSECSLAGIGSGHPDHVMTRSKEFGNDAGTDKAGGAGKKYAHEALSVVSGGFYRAMRFTVKAGALSGYAD
jgi:hypothetical protein